MYMVKLKSIKNVLKSTGNKKKNNSDPLEKPPIKIISIRKLYSLPILLDSRDAWIQSFKHVT